MSHTKQVMASPTARDCCSLPSLHLLAPIPCFWGWVTTPCLLCTLRTPMHKGGPGKRQSSALERAMGCTQGYTLPGGDTGLRAKAELALLSLLAGWTTGELEGFPGGYANLCDEV